MWGTDQAASVEIGGLIRLVSNIRDIERSLGDGVKRVYPSELRPAGQAAPGARSGPAARRPGTEHRSRGCTVLAAALPADRGRRGGDHRRPRAPLPLRPRPAPVPARGSGTTWCSTPWCRATCCGLVIAAVIDWLDRGTGLSRLHLVSDWPLWVQLVFFIVTHDLYIYLFHRLQHRVPLLWRIHEAHHSGRQVDFLSGARSHAAGDPDQPDHRVRPHRAAGRRTPTWST